MWVMIRTPEGRLTFQVPRRLTSSVMSGKIGPNLSPLPLKSSSFALWGRREQIPAHLSPKSKSQEEKLEKNGAKLDGSSTFSAH